MLRNGTGLAELDKRHLRWTHRMPHAPSHNKRFAREPPLWHGAAMKNLALIITFCSALLACHPAATASGDPGTQDDATDDTSDDAGGDGGDAPGCMAIGCPCTVNSDCTSKLCGAKLVCVTCIATNGGVEKCDGLDNNCNGLTDESTCPGDGHCMLGACDGTSNKCHMVAAQDLLSCDDGNACTLGDKCATGVCAGEANTCVDGNPCTSEACDPATGCVYLPMAVTCDDGNACTLADTCTGTVCAGSAKDCTDSNPCTTDSCAGGICLSTANTATCDDGNACTTGDVCANLLCAGVTNCQDGDPCTLDTCGAGNTCTHTPRTGWLAPLCATCAPGFSGTDCGACTDSAKSWPDC